MATENPPAHFEEESLWPLAADETASADDKTHLLTCETCRERVRKLRNTIGVLRRAHDAQSTLTYAPEIERESDTTPTRSTEWIGDYRIVRKLAQGGQGEVYLALHPQLNTDVVIKVARSPAGSASDSIREEARRLANLPHVAGLARVYDLREDNGRPFVVMQNIRGVTFQDKAAEGLTPADAGRLVAQAAEILQQAHAVGVAHLDIKPSNLMIDPQGQVWVIDFGMARISYPWGGEADSIGGTPAFMAPEQAREWIESRDGLARTSGGVGLKSDLFSLGATLYALLCGHPPFQGQKMAELRARIAACEFPPLPSTRGPTHDALARVCQRAMAKAPVDRFASAADFARAIRAAIEPAPSRKGTRKWAFAAVVFVLAAPFIAVAVMVAGPLVMQMIQGNHGSRAIEAPQQQMLVTSVLRQDPDRVLAPKSWTALRESMPLAETDRLILGCEVPRGQIVATYFLDETGAWRLLERRRVAPGEGLERVKLLAMDAWAPVGPAGVAMMMFIVTPDEPPGALEIQPLWEAAARSEAVEWANFPRNVLLVLQRGETVLEAEETPRGISDFNRAFDQCDEFRKSLQARFPNSWGFVVPRGGPSRAPDGKAG